MNKKNNGFILVSIVVLIVLAAIVLTVAMYLLNEVIVAERASLSLERLRGVETRVQGHPFLCHNDAGSHMGYFAESIVFPGTTEANLDTLMANVDAFKRSDGDSLSAEDAYGNKIDLASSGGSYTITAYGRDGAAGGSGDDADQTITIPESYRTGCSVAIRIVDASVSGNVTVTGTTGDYFVNGYTSDTADPQWGRTILISNDLSVSLYHPPNFNSSSLTPLVYKSEADSPVSARRRFYASNISVGYHLMYVQPDDVDLLDPYWQGKESGLLSNKLSTYIFVSPTTQVQQFNVVYPVIARAYALRETGGSGAHVHQDKTVDSDGTNYDYLDPFDPMVDNDPYEYLLIGNGKPFGQLGAPDLYRSILKFTLTGASGLPGFTIGTSRVVFAQLTVNSHVQVGLKTTSATLYIQAYRFLNAWDETTALTWADVQTYGSSADYYDLQDEESYNATVGGAYTPFLVFDVTKAVQKWGNGSWTNNGFLLKEKAEGNNDYYAFKCQESSSTNLRPRLTVAYYR